MRIGAALQTTLPTPLPRLFAESDSCPYHRADGATHGHNPGAVHQAAIDTALIPELVGSYRRPTADDGTFKPFDELGALFTGKGITPDKEVITYCVRAGLSSHPWFVLKYLLGYPQVREYDGSWAEWSNLIGAPIAK